MTTTPGFAPTTGAKCCAIRRRCPTTFARCSRRRTPMLQRSSPRPAPCSVNSCARCARGSRRTTASRRRPTDLGATTRASAMAGSTASSAGARASGGAESVLLDGDARAAGKAFFQLGAARHSPDHRLFAWSADDKGSEMHDDRRARIAGRRRPCPTASRIRTGDIVWTRDSSAFLYVLQDENHRPWRVMLHRLGSAGGRGRLRSSRRRIQPGSSRSQSTRLGRRAFIPVHGHDASEAHVVDLEAPARRRA